MTLGSTTVVLVCAVLLATTVFKSILLFLKMAHGPQIWKIAERELGYIADIENKTDILTFF